jgi:hypothetical protein
VASDSETPRKKRKPAFIVRADLFAASDDGGAPTVFFGECWAAVTADDQLIANGADIEAVTTAAFRAGFQIAEQPVDA